MLAQTRQMPGGWLSVLAAVLGQALVLLALTLPFSHDAQAQAAIQITKVRELSFGYCDGTPGATFSVAPMEVAGAGACAGAASARFEVVAEPNRMAVLSILRNLNLTNGADTLRVSMTASQATTGGGFCLGSGTLTIWVGGAVTIPGAGLATSGLFSSGTDISLAYKGNKTC